MNPRTHRLAVLLTVAVAGAASMATSPPDDGRVAMIDQTYETELSPFELTDDAPEMIYEVILSAPAPVTPAGLLTVELAAESQGAVELLASVENATGPGDFSAKTISGMGEMTVDSYVTTRATLRVRKLGRGSVQGGGKLTLSTALPPSLKPEAFLLVVEAR